MLYVPNRHALCEGVRAGFYPEKHKAGHALRPTQAYEAVISMSFYLLSTTYLPAFCHINCTKRASFVDYFVLLQQRLTCGNSMQAPSVQPHRTIYIPYSHIE